MLLNFMIKSLSSEVFIYSVSKLRGSLWDCSCMCNSVLVLTLSKANTLTLDYVQNEL